MLELIIYFISGYYQGLLRPPPVPGAGHPGGHPGPPALAAVGAPGLPGVGAGGAPRPGVPGLSSSIPGYPSPGNNYN